MRKLILTKLTLQNFKGIRSLKVNFGASQEIIYGENEAGKTTIFDAFCWLLFGKDSEDRADFDIKTLEPNNKPVHKLTHSVEGVFDIDGIKQSFKREYKEKWVKKKGNSESEFSGHETNFFIDEIPVNKKDYEETINLIIPSGIFRLITDPFFFPKLHWEKKRSLVFEVAGKVTYQEVAKGNANFKKLLDMLENKSIEQMKLKIRGEKKPLKEAIEDIPPKIEELQQNNQLDFTEAQVKLALKAVNAEISALEEKITSKNNRAKKKTEEFEARQAQLREINNQMVNIEQLQNEQQHQAVNKKKEEWEEVQYELRKQGRRIEEVSSEIRKASLRREALEDEINSLLLKYKEENEVSFVFNPEEAICPTCNRELDNVDEIKDELKENFEKKKVSILASIKEQGKEKRSEQEKYDKEIADYKQEIETLNSSMTKNEIKNKSLTQDIKEIKIEPPEELTRLHKERENLKEVIENFEQTFVDTSDLKAELDVLKEKKEGIVRQKIEVENEAKTRERIEELKEEERKLNNELSKLEKTEFLIQEFEYKEIEMMEDKISKKYRGVKFKMFNRLINGGMEATCEILINGVPFSSANNAAKINTGILIANTHSEHYGVSAPIFIDNAEAVNQVQKSKSQLVKLYVIDPKTNKETEEEYLSRLDFYKKAGTYLEKK